MAYNDHCKTFFYILQVLFCLENVTQQLEIKRISPQQPGGTSMLISGCMLYNIIQISILDIQIYETENK